MSKGKKLAAALLPAAALGVALAGCGTPGAPLPPSLNLPDRVSDLSAVRTGNQVALHWTMPRRNTDKLMLKGSVDVHICRAESTSGCTEAGRMSLAPGAAGTFTEQLPAPLAAGSPRTVRYFVELKNSHGRSAGASNAAIVPAGQAPAAVSGLAAELTRSGVVLRWNPLSPDQSIRLHRTLLNPPTAKSGQGPLPANPEPVNQSLLVEHDPGKAIDKDVLFDRSYDYRAQRIARVASGDTTVELTGEISQPIHIDVRDIFPPEVPTGLAAVAIAAGPAGPASIDLSWQPSADPDVAGYFVYRREEQTPWQGISGGQAVMGPAFHDGAVVPGHTYFYAVSAVDQRGNESSRSAEASETVPNP